MGKPLKIGDHATIADMSDRSGTIDRFSIAPGELIARIDDHWYLAGAVIVGQGD